MQDYTGFDEIVTAKDIDAKRGVFIHPFAQVAKGAELGRDVRIGPGALVGPKVILGDGVKIGANAIIDGRVCIGKDSQIFPMVTVGSAPQDLKYRGEDSEVIIGERNMIREYVNISLGTAGDQSKTIIGHNNLIMVYSHIAHDCIIGDHCILANGAQLAGHVKVGNRVVFGGLSAAHQFTHFGDLAMMAAGSMISQDVPPFCVVHGDHAKPSGLNIVGLRRAGIKNISDIKTLYRLTYKENLPLDDAIKQIELNVADSEEKQIFIKFLNGSQRGICR